MNLSILIHIITFFLYFFKAKFILEVIKLQIQLFLEILTFLLFAVYIFCILKTFPMQGFFYLSYFYTFNLVICSWSWLPNKRTWLLKLNMYLCLVLNEKGHSTTYISCFYVVVLLCTINFGLFLFYGQYVDGVTTHFTISNLFRVSWSNNCWRPILSSKHLATQKLSKMTTPHVS